MSFFSGLEGGLEKYIEGFFRDKFKGRVQPLDIAKRLAREMRDRKRVSVNLVYVPNEYEVFLSPGDFETISYLSGALASEMQDYLKEKADEKDFTLVAPPRVVFSSDESLQPGQIRVNGKFGAPAENIPVSVQQPDGEKVYLEDTLKFQPSRDTMPVPVVGEAEGCALEATEGPLAGKTIKLEGYPVVLGRREYCDIVLPDGSVSRRHARLEPQKGRWVLTDLNSTNGTFVNGERVQTRLLSPGDSIRLGSNLFAFKVDEID